MERTISPQALEIFDWLREQIGRDTTYQAHIYPHPEKSNHAVVKIKKKGEPLKGVIIPNNTKPTSNIT